MSSKGKRGEISLFLIYAFAIPLVCIGLMKGVEKIDAHGGITFILYGIEAAAPAAAAVIVTVQKHGGRQLKNFIYEKFIQGCSVRVCALAVGIPAAVLTVSKLLTFLTPYHGQFVTGLSVKKIIIILWALVAEELGWRGYLQERLEARVGRKMTGLVMGIIWAAWHYHFFIFGSMEAPILLFIYGCISESYGYYVITKAAKGNIVPASLWHFTGNLLFNLYRLSPDVNNTSIVPYAIVSAAYAIYFLLFTWYTHKHDK